MHVVSQKSPIYDTEYSMIRKNNILRSQSAHHIPFSAARDAAQRIRPPTIWAYDIFLSASCLGWCSVTGDGNHHFTNLSGNKTRWPICILQKNNLQRIRIGFKKRFVQQTRTSNDSDVPERLQTTSGLHVFASRMLNLTSELHQSRVVFYS